MEKIATNLGVSVDQLNRMIDIDPDLESLHFIVTSEAEDAIDFLGDSRRERQATGSLILLLVWHEVYEKDEIETGDLKDTLAQSQIDPTNFYHMYGAMDGRADQFFDRSPGSHTLKLSRPGRREDYKVLNDLGATVFV